MDAQVPHSAGSGAAKRSAPSLQDEGAWRDAHMQGMLRVIRNTSQSIIGRSDPQCLVERLCADLISTMSYLNAWVALLGESGEVTNVAAAGIDEAFEAMRQRLSRNELPACARRVLEKDADAVAVVDLVAECGDCPLAAGAEGRAGLAARLEYDGHRYGVMVASVPCASIRHAETQAFFSLLADEVGFALHRLDVVERLRLQELILNEIRDQVTLTDMDGRILYVNPAESAILGRARADLLGKSVEIFGEDSTRGPTQREIIERTRREGEWRGEVVNRTKDGGEVILDCHTWVVRDASGAPKYMCGVGRDITEQKQAQSLLRASKEHYRRLFDSMVSGFALHEIVLDADGKPCNYRFLEVNPAFERLTGLRGQDILGRLVLDVLPGTEPEWIATYGRVATSGESVRFEKFSGELGRHFAITAYSPAPNQFATVINDITERKKAEQDRERMVQQIQETQKLESLGVLAGGIAHDFNNILMAILGNAELAREDIPKSNPAHECIHHIEVSARRAADLCRQMLAYAGRASFVLERLAPGALIDGMMHLLKASVSKKAALNIHLARDLPLIEADSSQIRQVVMNLVTNASEAIGDTSGSISVSTGFVHCDENYLSAFEWRDGLAPGPYVCIEVSDTGSGMDAATRQRMFEPFFTTKFTGRGLGLAAVLGIMRAHRGAIHVYSEPGKGTTVKVLFPALDVPVEKASPAPPSDEAWHGSGTVLVVDDEEAVRVLSARMLERLGYDVLMASDGREALDVYRKHGKDIALVLLDLTMPRLDGAQAYSELRRLDPKVRVILASGYSEADVAARFAGKGLAGVIQKPYSLDKLRDLLAKLPVTD